jgi:peroxiredoxin
MTQTLSGLSVGAVAPDFELKDQTGTKVSLSSFKGKQNVVLVFIPFSFTGTCTGELCAIRDDIAAFQNDNVQVCSLISGHMAQRQRHTESSMKISAAQCAEHLSSIKRELSAGR